MPFKTFSARTELRHNTLAHSAESSMGMKMEQISSSAEEANRRSLFVHALSPSTTTEELTDFFSQSFPLKHATVVSDPTSKLSKGYGFVTFTDPSDASEALKTLNGSLFDGHKIKLELAKPRSRDPASRSGRMDIKTLHSLPDQKKAPPGRERLSVNLPPQLIVRNLPWTIDKPDQLAALFKSYGKIKRATMPKRKPGFSAGFGFVVLRGRKNSEKALTEVNGKVIHGRRIAVDWAVGKDAWESMNQSKSTVLTRQKTPPTVEGSARAAAYERRDLENASESTEQHNHTDEESLSDGEGSDVPSERPSRSSANNRTLEEPLSTLFIRNVPFTVTDEDLKHQFSSFGHVRYARTVMDPSTGRSRGTAFIAFWEEADAVACFQAAPKTSCVSTPSAKMQSTLSDLSTKNTILEDSSIDPSGRYTMDGRILQLSRAVNKGEAIRLTAAGHGIRDVRDRDKRHLFLLSEGTIPKQSPLYGQLAPSDVALREESARQRQNLLKNNPALHLSLTRLSVRNLPRSVTSKDLKALAREAVVGFSCDVKKGIRQPLSKEELARAGGSMREAERARRARGKGIVKQSKVVFEGRKREKVAENSGAGRSKGYAFIEYTSHRWALMGLRWLNGHALEARSREAPKTPSSDVRKKRLIVEFAIENAQVVGRRQEREDQLRAKSPSARTGRMLKARQDAERLPLGTNEPMLKGVGRAGVKRRRTPNTSSDHLENNGNEIEQQDVEAAERLSKRQKVIGRKRMARRARKSERPNLTL
ncbi:MAG: hypothetical protein Q9204_006304 [Flavoplaca sp. TL-2023a]